MQPTFQHLFEVEIMPACFLLISNTFISNVKLKLAKNQANGTQNSEAELLLFENYSYSSSMLSSRKKMRQFAKKKVKLIIMKFKMKMKNRSHRYNINKSGSTHGHKYGIKGFLSMMMPTCIKQHLSNI